MKYIMAAVLFLATTTVFAQNANSQFPTNIHTWVGAQVFVFYATVNENPVAGICMEANRWAIKLGTAGAQEVISTVIAAKVSGRKISVKGNGTCETGNYGYKIEAIYLE